MPGRNDSYPFRPKKFARLGIGKKLRVLTAQGLDNPAFSYGGLAGFGDDTRQHFAQLFEQSYPAFHALKLRFRHTGDLVARSIGSFLQSQQ